MAIFAKGEVVLINYPFSDLSGRKVRPALVLAVVGKEDYILCQITSKPFGSETSVAVDPQINATAGLRQVSYARPEKLFTANQILIIDKIGSLEKATFQHIIERLIEILRK